METLAIQNSTATAALAGSLHAQNAGLYVVLKSLQEIEEMQAQMMASLGIGQNIDVIA